ncbi:MAG: trypsin-like peptidase domain-containing protein [Deltaproteobacteria bacterium]|jgi:S1-C subfamily serine protease|nr:trypsin-like peptidase domain-containing protein [Deltaproteobacteria bacterium]
MEKYDKQKNRFSLWLVLGLILTGLWLIADRTEKPRYDKEAAPRVVEARGDLAEDEKNTIAVFQEASPSVVYITSIEVRRSLFSLNVYEIPQGTGSGFIWDREGRIVTNYHVIGDASRIEVSLGDDEIYKGILVGAAPDKDIAVLQINAPTSAMKPIPVGDSQSLQVGQKVFAIGNPFGLDHTITSGIVSALDREITAVTGRTIQGVIQTDAAINPGNSGGPLLDSAGRLIGVNTAIYSPSGASAGIGFAVPVDVVNRVVPQLIRHGKVIRPGIGVTLASDRITRRLDIEGLLVINVQPGSAADKAGIRETRETRGRIILGDIIIAVNGVPVESYNDLRDELENYQIGDEVILIILRDSEHVEVELQLEGME